MIDDLKNTFGEKGMYIVVIVAVALFIIALVFGGSGSKTDTVVAYASYPDAYTNANVIIDEVNNHTSTVVGEAVETIIDTNQDLINNTAPGGTTNFPSTVLPNEGMGTISKEVGYYPKTSYTGVSLVDGMKSVGVYNVNGQRVDNWQSRSGIAQANGISNYTGTAAQNTQLLNLLKTGKLVKP